MSSADLRRITNFQDVKCLRQYIRMKMVKKPPILHVPSWKPYVKMSTLSPTSPTKKTHPDLQIPMQGNKPQPKKTPFFLAKKTGGPHPHPPPHQPWFVRKKNNGNALATSLKEPIGIFASSNSSTGKLAKSTFSGSSSSSALNAYGIWKVGWTVVVVEKPTQFDKYAIVKMGDFLPQF